MREHANNGIRMKSREIGRTAAVIGIMAAILLLAGSRSVYSEPVFLYLLVVFLRCTRAKARRADLLRALAPEVEAMAKEQGERDLSRALLSLYRYTLRRCALRVLLGGGALAASGFLLSSFIPGGGGISVPPLLLFYGLGTAGTGLLRLLLSFWPVPEMELGTALLGVGLLGETGGLRPREIIAGLGSSAPVLYFYRLGEKELEQPELTKKALCRAMRGRVWLSVVGLVYLLIVAFMTRFTLFFLRTDPRDAGTIALVFCTLLQFVALALIARSFFNPGRRLLLLLKILRKGVELQPDSISASGSFRNPERTLMNMNPEAPEMLHYAVIGRTAFRCGAALEKGACLTARIPGETLPFAVIRQDPTGMSREEFQEMYRKLKKSMRHPAP